MPADDRDADRRELLRLMTTLRDLVNASRFEELKVHLAREFALTMISGERLTDMGSLDRFLRRWFTGPDHIVRSVRAEPVIDGPVRFIGADHAIAHGSMRETFEMRLGSYPFDMLWTAVLAREGGAWKVMSFQASVDVLNNPVVRRTGRLAAIGTVGGVAAGALAASLAKRGGQG